MFVRLIGSLVSYHRAKYVYVIRQAVSGRVSGSLSERLFYYVYILDIPIRAMPVLQKKTLIWKCRQENCDFSIAGLPPSEMKDKGFEHQKTHTLVEENRDWFNNHIRSFFAVTSA